LGADGKGPSSNKERRLSFLALLTSHESNISSESWGWLDLEAKPRNPVKISTALLPTHYQGWDRDELTGCPQGNSCDVEFADVRHLHLQAFHEFRSNDM
jgi:hypothetical protein